uniref:HipA N-terminal domain-containing protein n=1 Tax=Yersinia mollaretii TaxID=33060 RepID=UPI0021BD1EF2
MKLDVQISGKNVAKLFRERDEYLLQYLPGISENNFISLTMPVRDLAWCWPRDLHPFFRQNLPEGYLLGIIREEFGPLLDGTDLSFNRQCGPKHRLFALFLTPSLLLTYHLPPFFF